MDALAIFVTMCIASFAPIVSLAAIFDVTKYGAVGDGKHDDTQAFLQAWKDVCSATSESPTLNIPAAKIFLLAPVNFQGPCKFSTVHVQVLGNLVAPISLDAWKGCVKNSWIVFSSVNNLIVDGSGQINGQGSFWWRQGRQSPTCGKQPTALHFYNCNNMKLSGLNHLNPPKSHISINTCNNVIIGNIHITATADSPNTDGIDISSSSQVQIHDLNIQTGDDCIAINNGCSHINITNVACGPGHGISVGSLGEGGSFATAQEVHVKNCNFTNAQNGCRIKTWPGGSGFAKLISFENITLNNVGNPIIINQHYCIKDVDTGLEANCAEQPKAVQVSDVTYRNVQGSSATKIGINLDCSIKVSCANIRMEHVHINGVGVSASCTKATGTASDTSPQVPCLSSK